MAQILIPLFYLFLFFATSLFAQEEPTSVAATDGLPSNLINNSVCVITGEYTDSGTDLVVAGPEPLSISRFYSSHAKEEGCGMGWFLNHHDMMRLGKTIQDGKSVLYSLLGQASGARLLYTCPIPEDKKKSQELHLNYPKGLVSGASRSSARLNIKNQHMIYSPQEEKLKVISPDGSIRRFERLKKSKDGGNLLHQVAEEKINGHTLTYKHHDDRTLSGIQLKGANGRLYSSIDCKVTKHPCSIHLKASSGKEVTYRFITKEYTVKRKEGQTHYRDEHCNHYLTSIESPNRPAQTYQYGSMHDSNFMHIIRKDLPNGRYLSTEYYRMGRNNVAGLQVDISDEEDVRLDRVKLQKAPVGHDNTSIVTHRFIYHTQTKKSKKDEKPEILSGTTEVFDAYLHKTSYSYNKQHRLTSIVKFVGEAPHYIPYREERYAWGGDEDGNLHSKYILDGSGRLLMAYHFDYDSHGNMLRKRLCGNLTGQNDNECEEKSFTYSHDGLNLLQSENESNGKSTLYSYIPGTDLVSSKFTTFKGQIKMREFYEYDSDAVLVKTTIDDGGSPDKNDLTGVTERRFICFSPRPAAPFGLPDYMEERYLNLKTGRERVVKRVSYEYSKEGNLIRQLTTGSNGEFLYSQAWEYDAHGNVTKEVDPLGQVIDKSYDANDNLIFVQGPRADFSIHYTYDFCNRLIKQEDSEHHVTTYRYDYLGNRIATCNAYGHETFCEYDTLGRPVRTLSPLVADENGQLFQPTETKQYNELNQVVAVTNAKGETIHTKYNIRGQPICITYPDQKKEKFIYNIDGTLKQKTEKNGTYTIYTRNYQGRSVKEEIFSKDHILLKCSQFTYSAFHLMESIDPEGLVTSYKYDGAGRLIATIKGEHKTTQKVDALGRVIEVHERFQTGMRIHRKEYDWLNRVTKEQILDGDGTTVLHESQYAYDAQGNQIRAENGIHAVTQTKYNIYQKPIRVIDALGQTTHIVYNHHFIDSYGLRVLQTTTTDPLGYQTIETSDNAGRVVEIARKDPLGNRVAYQRIFYDANGNKSRQVDHVIEDGKTIRELSTIWQYNENNQLVILIEAAGTPEQKITHYNYNTLSQLSSMVKPDGRAVHYAYDALGRLIQLQAGDGSLSYTYTYNLNDQPIEVTDGLYTTKRTYNLYGEMIVEELGNGLKMHYTYDHLGRATCVVLPDDSRIEYVYNALDLKEVHRCVANKPAYSHVNLSHDPLGQVTRTQLPGKNGNVTYKYDSLGRCVDIVTEFFKQAVPEKGGYDAAGNLLSYCTDQKQCSFAYDDNYNLKEERSHTEHDYSCDSLSNRTKQDGQSCTYNHLNQLLRRGDERYEYDLNGNMIKRVEDERVIHYTYDVLNRLTSVSYKGREVHYTYDSFNRRLSKKEDGKAEQLFFYQGIEEVGAWQEGAITELKVLGDGRKRRLIAIELKQQAYVPIQDLFGHPICLVDLQGQVVERYRYTAFGEEEILNANGQQISSENPWRYAGKRFDEETGFVAFGMRYYDPMLGRWITADPIGYEDGPNLYAYLHHRPLTLFDAFGLFAEGSLLLKFIRNTSECPFPEPWYFDIESQYRFNSIDEYEESWNWADHDTPPLRFAECSARYHLNQECFRDVNAPPLIDQMDKKITFINGIRNGFDDFSSSMQYLGQMSQMHNIHGVHSATFGWCRDLLYYTMSRAFYMCFESVRLLHEEWDEFFRHASPEATLLHFCHSRGVAYTKNALMSYSEELRKRIEVVAIAPAAFIDAEFCKSVTHYVSRDFIPYADPEGMKRCANTVVFLDPHPNASYWDHPFQSPTYEEYLRKHVRNYLGK